MNERMKNAAIRAVDYLSDALKFAKEAQLESELGNAALVKHFANLALAACEDAKAEMRLLK